MPRPAIGLHAHRRPAASPRARALAGLLALSATCSVAIGTALPRSLAAQGSTDWITREQDALWVGAFVEQPVNERLALWFDGSWRRMDLGLRPQQLLLRPGLLYTVAPGVKLGAGYAYVATAPYGRVPGPTPLREQRSWQELQLAHQAGRVSVSHRFRLEQRWTRPVLGDTLGATRLGATSSANRLRYRVRGQINLGGLTLAGQPVAGFVWDELLMPIGGAAQQFTLGQNRATVGVAVPLSPTMKVEVGYMNLYNAFASRRVNEVNHTLWISWHYTGTAQTRKSPRKPRAA